MRMGQCSGYVRRTFTLCAALTVSVWGTFSARAEGQRPAAVVLQPKRDSVVGRYDEVMGKVVLAGQPVVLIRPMIAGGQWWVQPPPETNERGYFRTKVRFGSDRSRPGDRFEILVVMVRSAEEANFFQGKEHLPSLPKTLAHSESIPVSLGAVERRAPAHTASNAVLIQNPKMHATVDDVEAIAGTWTGAGWPVVLVRSDEPNDVWWVQGPVVTTEKKHAFTAQVRFGNDRSRDGQQFRMVVLILPTERAAEQVPPGTTFEQLPADLPCSEEILVSLRRSAPMLGATSPP